MPVTLQWVLDALLVLTPVSVGIRILILLMKMNTDPDQEQQCRTRIKNALIYVVAAESVYGVLRMVFDYIYLGIGG